MRFRRIVVGIDGSHHSDRAASAVADLAEVTGAEVVAVHAMGMREDAPGPDQTVAERREQVRRTFESTWTELLRRTGTAVRCELRDGHPVDVLLAVVDEVDADLLVVGSRGTGASAAGALGSMSAQLAAQATRPMLLVPDVARSD